MSFYCLPGLSSAVKKTHSCKSTFSSCSIWMNLMLCLTRVKLWIGGFLLSLLTVSGGGCSWGHLTDNPQLSSNDCRNVSHRSVQPCRPNVFLCLSLCVSAGQANIKHEAQDLLSQTPVTSVLRQQEVALMKTEVCGLSSNSDSAGLSAWRDTTRGRPCSQLSFTWAFNAVSLSAVHWKLIFSTLEALLL